MELTTKVSGVPYIDQYLGVWSMYPPALQSFKTLAEQININVHMTNEPVAQTALDRGGGVQSVTDKNGIATIELHGTLLKHASSFSANTSTVEARRMVRAAKNDPNVEAVLLHIDSPGGTVAGTDDLGDDIASLQKTKPTMAYIEDLGASAAYWLASQTGTIYSNAQAVVGSIGVLSVVYDLSRKAEAENITVHVIKAGEMKGAGVPGSLITEEQIAEWQKLVDAFYDDFISAISEGRGIPKARATELADGRVHIGQVAVDLGLTDGVRSLDQAFSELVAQTERGTSNRRTAMSADNDRADDVAAKPATIGELKGALPNAESDFILSQIESGATLAEAQTAFIAVQDAKLQEREAALAEAENDAKKSQTTVSKPQGQKPLKDSGEADAEDETFESLVAQTMESEKVNRRMASRMVAKSHRELHEEFLDRSPPGRL